MLQKSKGEKRVNKNGLIRIIKIMLNFKWFEKLNKNYFKEMILSQISKIEKLKEIIKNRKRWLQVNLVE